jgi:rubrerythrin
MTSKTIQPSTTASSVTTVTAANTTVAKAAETIQANIVAPVAATVVATVDVDDALGNEQLELESLIDQFETTPSNEMKQIQQQREWLKLELFADIDGNDEERKRSKDIWGEPMMDYYTCRVCGYINYTKYGRWSEFRCGKLRGPIEEEKKKAIPTITSDPTTSPTNTTVSPSMSTDSLPASASLSPRPTNGCGAQLNLMWHGRPEPAVYDVLIAKVLPPPLFGRFPIDLPFIQHLFVYLFADLGLIV